MSSATSCNPVLSRRLSRRSSSSSFSLQSPSLNSVRLRRIFDLFDKNGDGILTVAELARALNSLGLDADVAELEVTVSSHIRPGLSGLLFDDFVTLHKWLDESIFLDDEPEECDVGGPDDESDLTEAFKVFDEDGDGYISATELQVVLGKLGFSEGNEMTRVEEMIGSVDRNHDGRVDFFEFKDMMRGVMARS